MTTLGLPAMAAQVGSGDWRGPIACTPLAPRAARSSIRLNVAGDDGNGPAQWRAFAARATPGMSRRQMTAVVGLTARVLTAGIGNSERNSVSGSPTGSMVGLFSPSGQPLPQPLARFRQEFEGTRTLFSERSQRVTKSQTFPGSRFQLSSAPNLLAFPRNP
jgi:hypothetical protein